MRLGLSLEGMDGVIRSEEVARATLRDLSRPPHPIVAFDTETVGWSPQDKTTPYERAKCVAFSLSDGKRAWCFDGPLLGVFRPLLERKTITFRGANLKYDGIVCGNHGIRLNGQWEDVILMAKLMSAGKLFSFGLKSLSKEFLGKKMVAFKELAGIAGLPMNRNHEFDVVMEADHYIAARYARDDAKDSWLLAKLLRKELSNLPWQGGRSMLEFYEGFKAPYTQVLRGMEDRGILVDQERLAKIWKQVDIEADQLQDYFEGILHAEFNIDATAQVTKILFDKFGLDPVFYTDTPTCTACGKKATKRTGLVCKEHGSEFLVKTPSTNRIALEELEIQHPDHEGVLKLRRLRKVHHLRKMFFPHLSHPCSDGRVRTSWNNMGAIATGRLSSGSPNLMNIPRPDNDDVNHPDPMKRGFGLRDLFLPEPDHVFVVADYSQLELRLGAHVSGDKNMIQAYKDGADIHAEAAIALFGLDCTSAEVKKLHGSLRDDAKVFNFGVFYGATKYRVAREFRCTLDEAQGFIDNYFGRFPGIKQLRWTLESRCIQNGHLRTLLGRYRFFPFIHRVGNSPHLRSKLTEDRKLKSRYNAEMRQAMNLPEQGGAADVIESAMLVLQGEVVDWHPLQEDSRFQDMGGFMQLQIHDELVTQVPKECAQQGLDTLIEVMSDPLPGISVPLPAEGGYGERWTTAKAA